MKNIVIFIILITVLVLSIFTLKQSFGEIISIPNEKFRIVISISPSDLSQFTFGKNQITGEPAKFKSFILYIKNSTNDKTTPKQITYTELTSDKNLIAISNTTGLMYSIGKYSNTSGGVNTSGDTGLMFGLPRNIISGNIVLNVLDSALKTPLILGNKYLVAVAVMNDNVYSNVSDPNDMYCCYTSDFAWSDEITYTAFSIPTMSLRLTALSTNQNSDKP